MLAIILWNYVLSLIIAHGSSHFRKTFLVTGIISNTGILFFYKYLSFTYDVVNRIWGLNIQAETASNAVLPIPLAQQNSSKSSGILLIFCKKMQVEECVDNVFAQHIYP